MKIAGYTIGQEVQTSLYRSSQQQVTVSIQDVMETPKPVDLGFSGATEAQSTEDDAEDLLSEQDRAKIKFMEHMLSAFLGRPFKFQIALKLPAKDASKGLNVQAYTSNGGQRTRKVSIERTESYAEVESYAYRANGVVKTKDGKEIAFDYTLNMNRAYYEEHKTRIDSAQALQDPLVLNLDGKGVKFSKLSIEMDLDRDGTAEVFQRLEKGSGFLALDKNHNGQIDDGGELFGPTTGHGFEELSKWDFDQNGWIDENDYVYKNLKVLSYDEQGEESLVALSQTGVGAIYLGAVDGSYQMKHAQSLMGVVRQSSIYLTEKGKAGVIHEIDLKV